MPSIRHKHRSGSEFGLETQSDVALIVVILLILAALIGTATLAYVFTPEVFSGLTSWVAAAAT